MQPLNLKIHSFNPPSTTTNHALSLKLLLPTAVNNPESPLSPATHLQLSYMYAAGKHEIFMPNLITFETLAVLDLEEGLFDVKISEGDIPRMKVGGKAEVLLYAWKGEKVLGRWRAGEVEMKGSGW